MQSFYGGPAGQSFEIKKIFESYYGPDGAQVDLDKGWASPISVGEFVMISYGLPSDTTYTTRMNYDLKAGNKKNLNSTLWQKVYDESVGEGSGLSYKFISSCTGNTPKIIINKPAIVLHPNEQPDVETDLSNQDMPVIQFKLPRAVKFYYGSLLGQKVNKTYTLTDPLFANYGVGDYYINESTGFIYKVTSKTNNTTCVFEYQATISQPLPTIKASAIAPYTEGDEGFKPAVPLVKRTLTNAEGTEWQLEFKLPQALKPAVSSTFVGSAEQGSATSAITSEDTVTFTFKIPTGSKLFVGLEITVDGATTTIDGARIGDIYLNSETGVLYTLTTNGWKASEKSIKGPAGDVLNIEAEYHLTETAEFAANLANGATYIQEHYSGTIDSHKIFAITWTLLNNGGDICYWYYKTNAGEWDRAQLTGGISSLIEQSYKENIDNKTYSINYINSLIGGNGDTSKTAFSKDQVQSLISWGSFEDLIEKP